MFSPAELKELGAYEINHRCDRCGNMKIVLYRLTNSELSLCASCLRIEADDRALNIDEAIARRALERESAKS